MRWLSPFLLFLFTATVWGQSKKFSPAITQIYNEEGQLQMTISYNPACSCRTYTEYFTDGKILARRIFKVTEEAEIVDGADVTYFHDGSIKEYKLWKNAVPDGRAYSLNDDGSLASEEFYEGKFKSGTWKYYDKFGRLLKEKIYPLNRTAWNSKNESVTIRHFVKGKLSHTEIFVAGKKSNTTVNDAELFNASGKPELTDAAALFALKCKACHSFDADGFGPSLAGITKRRSLEWISGMIVNADKLIEMGDKDAIAIYNKWHKRKHPNLEKLTGRQVQAIVDFLKGK